MRFLVQAALIVCTALKWNAIPQSIAAYNEAFKEKNYENAKKQYDEWVPLFGAKPSECISCRQCEKICPQHIEISRWMNTIHAFFNP